MIDITLAALANQEFTVQIDERMYDISLHEANGVMSASITRDNVDIITGVRVTAGTPLLPYQYEEAGNFILTVEAESVPYYDQFGITQFLVYLTTDELAAYRGT